MANVSIVRVSRSYTDASPKSVRCAQYFVRGLRLIGPIGTVCGWRASFAVHDGSLVGSASPHHQIAQVSRKIETLTPSGRRNRKLQKRTLFTLPLLKIPTPNERITEIPILDTIAPSHEGSERTRLPSDRAQPSSTKEPTATESATAKNIEATYSPSRGDGDTVAVHATRSSRESVEGSRKKNMGAEEPVAAIISTLAAGETDTPQQQHQRLPNTEKVKPAGADNRGAFANQDLRHDECEADDNGVEGSSGDVNHQDTSGASCMTSPQEEANALSIAATAEEATTVANDDEEKEAREREACAKLMKMRAEKQDIIRGESQRKRIRYARGGCHQKSHAQRSKRLGHGMFGTLNDYLVTL